MDLEIQCDECGAKLAFNPGNQALTCNYCNHTMEIEGGDNAEEAFNEIDLDSYLKDFESQNEQVEQHVIHCQSCGAETELESNQQSARCPFCDTPLIIAQSQTKKSIKPKGLLPFQIEANEAREAFRTWIDDLWFAPNKLKKQRTQHDRFEGVYLPFWTYDCDTSSYYVGQRGEYYYVTVSTTDSDGKPTTKR